MGPQLQRDDILRQRLVACREAGFTLVEAIIALVISSVIVVLVSQVFLIQNQYYAVQLSRSQAHDNVRMVTEIVGGELRSLMADGVQVAENKQLVIRSPMLLGVVCATVGGSTQYVHMEGGEENVDTLEVAGFAERDPVGGWNYYTTTWDYISLPGGTPAASCASNGADTTGTSAEFFRLRRLQTFLGGQPDLGTLIMLFREIEYKFDTSTMDSTAVGLYRGNYGETLTEYATGMDTTAQFQYRTGGSSYANSVSGAGLATIDAIRIVAEARKSVAAGGVEDVTYGWSVNIPLRNAN